MATTKKKNVTKNKTHGLFYSLIRQLPDYRKEYADAIKEGLVGDASCGRTESLTVLYDEYPAQYAEMIEGLKVLVKKANYDLRKGNYQDAECDKWRKRCIAAVCGWLDLRKAHFEKREDKVSYAIGCICRAASCNDVNLITVERLTDIYNEYLRKQKTVANGEVITDFGICEN